MDPMEFLARLAAPIAPPRYPLVRHAGVLGPRSAWRRDVVPRPREPLVASTPFGRADAWGLVSESGATCARWEVVQDAGRIAQPRSGARIVKAGKYVR